MDPESKVSPFGRTSTRGCVCGPFASKGKTTTWEAKTQGPTAAKRRSREGGEAQKDCTCCETCSMSTEGGSFRSFDGACFTHVEEDTCGEFPRATQQTFAFTSCLADPKGLRAKEPETWGPCFAKYLRPSMFLPHSSPKSQSE